MEIAGKVEVPKGSCGWGMCNSCALTNWLISYMGSSQTSCIACYWKYYR